MRFEIRKRDAAGRLGKFTTNHGTIRTPTLLPVIHPKKMIITPKEMQELLGIEMVITNSYIIRKDNNLRSIALKEGVHQLLDFDGPIMTDSGTFQSYVYGDVTVSPDEIISFQRDIGTDIGTILDIFGTPDQSKEEASEGVSTTIIRAKESMKLKGDMGIALPVQGSIYPDLRAKCAAELGKLQADLFPIGGVVPLMEQQRYPELIRVILAAKQHLPMHIPVHLFGAGHPLIFPLAVALGCDLFDSSAYIKYALEKRMIFSWGTLHLEDIYELPCCCPICSQFTAQDLKKLPQKEMIRQIAFHNLYVCMEEIKKIRNALDNGTLWDLVEQKGSENPYISDALHILRNDTQKQWLETFEPVRRKKALTYTGPQTIHRPILYRTHQRLLERYPLTADTLFIIDEKEVSYADAKNVTISTLFESSDDIDIIIDSSLGPIPLALYEMYPFAQSVFPNTLDQDTLEYTKRIFSAFTKNKKIKYLKGTQTAVQSIKNSMTQTESSFDHQKIKAIAAMQFGLQAATVLFDGNITLVKSKKTQKIRNVFVDNSHVLSFRASDGFFTLKKAGAFQLHKALPFPSLRVIIDDEAAPFVKEGKSVFSKFIIEADPALRPYDECLIVRSNDTLLAVGQCLLNPLEMMQFSHGQAVKNREYFS